MGEIGIYILLSVIFIAVAVGLPLLVYWIPKKIGYPRTGKFLATIVGLFFLYLAFTEIFEDQLFSKNDAIKFLAKQDIKLKDGFELIENKSYGSVHNPYHFFKLKISGNDKSLIISQIKSSPDFKGLKDSKEDICGQTDRFTGKKVIQNYEEVGQFVRESLEPIRKGYAPNHFKLGIEKKENLLIFEDL